MGEIYRSGALTGQLLHEGEWVGWYRMGGDPFVDLAGPFFYRMAEDGSPVYGMKVEHRHLNGGDAMHGGALGTFIDCALFAFARTVTDQRMVTLSLRSDFIAPAPLGAILHCTGQVTEKTGSMVFVRGIVAQSALTIASFDAILKVRPPLASPS